MNPGSVSAWRVGKGMLRKDWSPFEETLKWFPQVSGNPLAKYLPPPRVLVSDESPSSHGFNRSPGRTISISSPDPVPQSHGSAACSRNGAGSQLQHCSSSAQSRSSSCCAQPTRGSVLGETPRRRGNRIADLPDLTALSDVEQFDLGFERETGCTLRGQVTRRFSVEDRSRRVNWRFQVQGTAVQHFRGPRHCILPRSL
jgi:hypothetical protein